MTGFNINRLGRWWEWYKKQQQTKSWPKPWIPVEPANPEKQNLYCKKLWKYLIHDHEKFNSNNKHNK